MIDWRNTWWGESVHRSVEREVDVGCEELMLGSNQRPGSRKLVVILGIDDSVGAGFAEMRFLPGARVRGVGGTGDRVGDVGRDFIVAELAGSEANALDHSRIADFDAVDNVGERSEEHT